MFVQLENGKFEEVVLTTIKWWRNGRVAYVTKSERPDLVVVGGELGAQKQGTGAFIHIYKAIQEPPYFDLTKPFYSLNLPNGAYDVEVLDVNDDSNLDIYISQANETAGYCAGKQRLVGHCRRAHFLVVAVLVSLTHVDWLFSAYYQLVDLTYWTTTT